MRTRLRLGAAGAVALGALLLATVLASPALAWHSTVEAEASCLPDGSVLVEFTVTPFEDGHDATVDVFYVLNDDKPVGLVSEGDLSKAISGEFDLPPGTTGTLTVVALVHWEKTGEKTKNKVHVDLPKCEERDHHLDGSGRRPRPRPPPRRRPRPPTTAPETEREPVHLAGGDDHDRGRGGWGHQHHRGRPAALHRRRRLRADAAGRDRAGRRGRPGPPGQPDPGPPRDQVSLP